jgi:hypothetical protein
MRERQRDIEKKNLHSRDNGVEDPPKIFLRCARTNIFLNLDDIKKITRRLLAIYPLAQDRSHSQPFVAPLTPPLQLRPLQTQWRMELNGDRHLQRHCGRPITTNISHLVVCT